MPHGAKLTDIRGRLQLLERGDEIACADMLKLIADLRAVAKRDDPDMEGCAAGFLALAAELEFAAASFYVELPSADRATG